MMRSWSRNCDYVIEYKRKLSDDITGFNIRDNMDMTQFQSRILMELKMHSKIEYKYQIYNIYY